VSKIVDALDAAFYATFQNVEPCGKPVLLALDVSGSMDGSMIAGSCLSAREASAAMALVTAATEPDCEIIAFSAARVTAVMHGGGESGITRVSLSPRMRLDGDREGSGHPDGWHGLRAADGLGSRNKLNVSAFVTYTDSETWAGNIHPAQALRQYRDEFVGDAKAVVVGMTSNGFTLADPNDRGMLDVVGFDTSVPAVIADFVRVQRRQEAITTRAEAKASACALSSHRRSQFHHRRRNSLQSRTSCAFSITPRPAVPSVPWAPSTTSALLRRAVGCPCAR
jgi:60 kDa SS-A/Ro ribonucleoprotein